MTKKKFKVELTEAQIEHVLMSMEMMTQDAEYGGKVYRDYTRLEASISRAFRKATQPPLTAEALADMRRTLNRGERE